MAVARICWVENKAGGRENPFTGSRYVTVARFEREDNKWPNKAWSLIVDFDEPLTQSRCVTAEVRFLAPDAPTHLLTTGSKFELYEGRQCVATGEVLSGKQQANETLSA